MPELPEVQALAERLDAALSGRAVAGIEILGFSALKTVRPAPNELVGRRLEQVSRRGKFLVLGFETGPRLLIHLGQAGRVDLEAPPKSTRGRGSVLRLVFGASPEPGPPAEQVALFVREYGHERQAGTWVLGPGDDGPLERLGPEVEGPGLVEALAAAPPRRRLHSLLRDQHLLAGIGRGYADDILNRAGLSPFATLGGLDDDERARLVAAVQEVLAEGLAAERNRTGGLSEARLGERFAVHNRAGEPCPRCGGVLERVSYASYEIVYCPACQTGGKALADRRLSRLLR